MRRALYAALLLSYFCIPGYAQDETWELDTVIESYDGEAEHSDDHVLVSPQELETSKAYGSEELVVRQFDEDTWKETVKGINYTEEIPEKKSRVTWGPWAGKVVKVISFVVIAGVLLVVIYYATRIISFDLNIERTQLDNNHSETSVDDIAELDIDQLLDQAKRQGNHKLAVRLYYLGLLKKLNEKGAIIWKKDKTNRDYLAELVSADLFFSDVRRLTLSYESVWYGDHDLTPERFQVLTKQFENLYGKINVTENA